MSSLRRFHSDATKPMRLRYRRLWIGDILPLRRKGRHQHIDRETNRER
jgi:hypothetical protein